jgi:hypothetical protein
VGKPRDHRVLAIGLAAAFSLVSLDVADVALLVIVGWWSGCPVVLTAID